MRYLPTVIMGLLLFCILGCDRNNRSMESDPLTQYRDTLIGNFSGIDIYTLIAEPTDTTIDRSLWNWRVYSKNNTVDTLFLSLPLDEFEKLFAKCLPLSKIQFRPLNKFKYGRTTR